MGKNSKVHFKMRILFILGQIEEVNTAYNWDGMKIVISQKPNIGILGSRVPCMN